MLAFGLVVYVVTVQPGPPDPGQAAFSHRSCVAKATHLHRNQVGVHVRLAGWVETVKEGLSASLSALPRPGPPLTRAAPSRSVQ